MPLILLLILTISLVKSLIGSLGLQKLFSVHLKRVFCAEDAYISVNTVLIAASFKLVNVLDFHDSFEKYCSKLLEIY